MVNTDDFIKRLEILLEFYNLSASVFADKMGVQRSGLSHLMSGRNKPSLDFVMKIVENFPEVDLYWLLNGEGNFPKTEIKENTITQPAYSPSPKKDEAVAMDLFSSDEITTSKENPSPGTPDLFSTVEEKEIKSVSSMHKEIEKIVIFYTDGTFKNYNPGN